MQQQTHFCCHWFAPCGAECNLPGNSRTLVKERRRQGIQPWAPSLLPGYVGCCCLWSASQAGRTAHPSGLACPSTWWQWGEQRDDGPAARAGLPCTLGQVWTSRRLLCALCGHWSSAWAFWWSHGSRTACWQWRLGGGTNPVYACSGACWPSLPYWHLGVGADEGWRRKAGNPQHHFSASWSRWRHGDEDRVKPFGCPPSFLFCFPTEPWVPVFPPIKIECKWT